MSPTARILTGLIAGLAGGALLLLHGGAGGAQAAAVIEPVGTVWLNGLKMTIIPLVLALLVTGVASAADAAASGGLTARALALFGAMLAVGVVLALGTTEVLLRLWPIEPGVAAALNAGADAAKVPPVPTTAETLTGLVPGNIFAALAAGDMLPIVLFGLAFAFAVTRLPPEPRERLLGLFRAVADAMFVIVGWVLWLAPLGVFALAFTVGYRTGFAAAAAIAQYVVVVSAVLIVQLLLMIYPSVALFSRVGLGRFARAALPAQGIALGTQSSLATLPAMLTATRSMGVSEATSGLVLPLAVALFRLTSPAANFAVAMFVTRMAGIEPSAVQIAAALAVCWIGNLAVVGIASASTFFVVIVPATLALGGPIGVLPLLLAVEVLPDLWRTVGNVTADLAAAAILDRHPRT